MYLNIIELQDEMIPDNASEKEIQHIQEEEALKIKKHLKPQDYNITLDLTGTQLSSEKFASKIQDITLKGFGTINFIIGGTTGLSRELVASSNFVFSFSQLTFPHQLIRLFLSEQIYFQHRLI